jgi:hypothetical protein
MQMQYQPQAHSVRRSIFQLSPNRTLLGIAMLATLSASGCGSHGPRPPEFASDAGNRAVAKYDTNKDGALDYDELAKAPGLQSAVATIKKMGNSRHGPPSESELHSAKITAADIDDRIKQWRSAGVSRFFVKCRVVRKGTPEPIANAEVKFIPEDFLGSNLPTGTGTTDAKGFATISPPGAGKDDPNGGLCPGFYRVEITKGSEIPAKYNKNTVLGQEVARDSACTRGGAVFELTY